jgi:hypothetical protein
MASESTPQLDVNRKDNPVIQYDEVVCTLFEGEFHLGVAALINSIVKGGYRGLFWVGYRGDLPPWLAGFQRDENGLYLVGGALLGFELVETAAHFTNIKPIFMKNLIDRGIAASRIWYFDPDITVRCEWSFYQRWVKFGICICQEYTMGTMPSRHPIRCEWMKLARSAGWGEPVNELERYFNAGFLGLEVQRAEFLKTWIEANKLAQSTGIDQGKLQHGSRADIFCSGDQDALNIAAMYSKEPLTPIGPEGMGWITGGFTMYHTVGGKKPWKKKFLLSSLSADPPWNGDRHFLDSVDGPLRPYSDFQLRKMRFSANLANLIGRFYVRR